jgi:lipoprotein-anchoring transpeptidase ErfK/SrfK
MSFREDLLVFLALLLAGCTAGPGSSANPFFPGGGVGGQSDENGDQISYWDDRPSAGKSRIVIDLSEQRAYFYRGNTVVGVSAISTGREGYDTPSGEFRVTEKDPTHVSSIYGDYVDRNGQVLMENVDATKDRRPRGAVFRGAPMPYFLRIHGSIGMHAGYLPGYPASHGCIRLPMEMAVRFFQNSAVGTPIQIRQYPLQDNGPLPVVDGINEPFSSIMQR